MSIIKIHNVDSGEIVERDMSDEELAQVEADKMEQDFIDNKKNQTAAAKAALLEKLGITDDEAKLLLS